MAFFKQLKRLTSCINGSESSSETVHTNVVEHVEEEDENQVQSINEAVERNLLPHTKEEGENNFVEESEEEKGKKKDEGQVNIYREKKRDCEGMDEALCDHANELKKKTAEIGSDRGKLEEIISCQIALQENLQEQIELCRIKRNASKRIAELLSVEEEYLKKKIERMANDGENRSTPSPATFCVENTSSILKKKKKVTWNL